MSAARADTAGHTGGQVDAAQTRRLIDRARAVCEHPGWDEFVAAAQVALCELFAAERAWVRSAGQVDDPQGPGDGRTLVVPVVGVAQPLAVLIIVRDAGGPPFSSADERRAALFASLCASTLTRLRLEQGLAARTPGGGAEGTEIFRAEAVRHHAGGELAEGVLLRLSPRASGQALRLVAFMGVATVSFAAFVQIDEYASGPAVVRIEGRTTLTAVEPMTVAAVLVQPGQRVTSGQVLVRFVDEQERAQRDRVVREFDAQLVKMLADPTDPSPRTLLMKLRADRDYAERRVEARQLRAPHDGVVSDLRSWPGQLIPAGAPVCTMTSPGSSLSLLAFLPGQSHPLLEKGQDLRLEVSGFPHAYQTLKVDFIGDDTVGPAEIARYLGPDLADTLRLSGPVVVARASLPSTTFESRGSTFSYHDGMQGLAEVAVRREPLALTLFPALRAVFRGAP
ncbi:MAG: HlyD family efflux transporter periplasmic adaptor subunit [Myxococcaceae bacterium]|nr:HlyD family efflux transporter periplasmic adaptor subunit [Myxococcaceae bacterium]